MGLDTAIATLAAAKALVGLAPVAGPVLAGVIDAGTEICKAAQVDGQHLHAGDVGMLTFIQNVKTNEEQYQALGERVSILCSSLANDQVKQELASDVDHGGQRIEQSQMDKKIEALCRCAALRHHVAVL
jgi:hypothetical protein